MNLIMKQMPVVVSALNVGFLQTLKLFIVTLVGALPLGLVMPLAPCLILSLLAGLRD